MKESTPSMNDGANYKLLNQKILEDELKKLFEV